MILNYSNVFFIRTICMVDINISIINVRYVITFLYCTFINFIPTFVFCFSPGCFYFLYL